MAETPTTEILPRLTWTADETAAVLGVTPDAIRNLHRVSRLQGVLIGRSLRWRPADVRAFVEGLERGEKTLTTAPAGG